MKKISCVFLLLFCFLLCRSQNTIKQKDSSALYKYLDIMEFYVKDKDNPKYIRFELEKKCDSIISFFLSDKRTLHIDETKNEYRVYNYKGIPVVYIVGKDEEEKVKKLLNSYSYLKKSDLDIYKIYYTYKLPWNTYQSVVNGFTIFYLDNKFYFRTEVPADMIENCNL